MSEHFAWIYDKTRGVKTWVADMWSRRHILTLENDVSNLQTAVGTIPTKTSELTNDSGFITAAAVPDASTAPPAMDGTGAAGTSDDYARADHVHPSDTSKQDALSAAQLAAVNSGITAEKVAEYDAYQKLGKTYTTNSYVNQTNFNRINAYKVGPHLAVVSFNLMINAAVTNGAFINIGRFDGVTLPIDNNVTIAGQNGDGYAILAVIKKDGIIQIYSTSASSSGEFFRAIFPIVVESFG